MGQTIILQILKHCYIDYQGYYHRQVPNLLLQFFFDENDAFYQNSPCSSIEPGVTVLLHIRHL